MKILTDKIYDYHNRPVHIDFDVIEESKSWYFFTYKIMGSYVKFISHEKIHKGDVVVIIDSEIKHSTLVITIQKVEHDLPCNQLLGVVAYKIPVEPESKLGIINYQDLIPVFVAQDIDGANSKIFLMVIKEQGKDSLLSIKKDDYILNFVVS